MNLITPIILIIISLGTFFVYVDPNYRGKSLNDGKKSVLSLLAEDLKYQEALKDAAEIRSKREALMTKKGAIDPNNLLRLEKLLPDNIDNIKLVIDMNRIAQNRALALKGVKLDIITNTDSGRLGQDNSKYGTVGLSFSVSTTYENFLNFLADLEKSLRLVEVTDLVVTSNDTGIYDFSVSLKTFWLK